MGAKYTKKQKEAYAAQMRANPTATERLMWEYIRDDQCGAAFERQVVTPCGWIADFLCESKKLIIEIDGAHHGDSYREDKRRDEAHAKVGYYTIRIQSQDVPNESPAYFKDHISWAIRNQDRLRGALPPEFYSLPVLDGYLLINASGDVLQSSYEAATSEALRLQDEWEAEEKRMIADRLKSNESTKTLSYFRSILRQVLEI